MSKVFKQSIIALTYLALSTGFAAAQDNPTPNRSVETYEDWNVECSNVTTPAKPAEGDTKAEVEKVETLCEVIQTYTNDRTKNEVARLVFAYRTDDKKVTKTIAVMRVLVDVSFEW